MNLEPLLTQNRVKWTYEPVNLWTYADPEKGQMNLWTYEPMLTQSRVKWTYEPVNLWTYADPE